MEQEKYKPLVEGDEKVADTRDLVLFNDEVNTFDHVIESLIDVLGHDSCQAEQCAWVAHLKGKCTVKSGSYHELKPACDGLLDRDLTVEIE